MNGPKLWADMLAAINIPGAVVAGGCIRDCFLSVPPKDIDIFVQCTSLEHWEQVKYSLVGTTGLGNMYDLRDTEEGKEYDKTDFDRDKNPLYGVLAGQLMGYEINLIARTNHATHLELVSMFDFGILQMFYDGDAVQGTALNMQDRYLQRATMAHDRHIEQSLDRFFRFNRRHPGKLSLNVPFEYERMTLI